VCPHRLDPASSYGPEFAESVFTDPRSADRAIFPLLLRGLEAEVKDTPPPPGALSLARGGVVDFCLRRPLCKWKVRAEVAPELLPRGGQRLNRLDTDSPRPRGEARSPVWRSPASVYPCTVPVTERGVRRRKHMRSAPYRSTSRWYHTAQEAGFPARDHRVRCGNRLT
jgi:hypothetical protein